MVGAAPTEKSQGPPRPVPGGVMVLAPAPQLTVTIEAGGHGSEEIHLHAGGQGLWIARLLSRLDVPTVLCASLGGESGAVVGALIESEGIELVGVKVDAPNGAHVHDRTGGQRRRVGGQNAAVLPRHQRDDFYNRALAAGLHAGTCVLGGYDPASQPIPPEDYRRLGTDLRSNGVRVVADLSGELREAAAAAGVDLLKTSDEDLAADDLIDDVEDRSMLLEVMVEMAGDHGLDQIVVTRAERGCLALVRGRVYEAKALRLEARDPRGGGDSMTAGLTAGLHQGLSLPEALRLGVAAAAMNVTRHGLGTGEAAAIRALVDLVEVEEIGPVGGESG